MLQPGGRTGRDRPWRLRLCLCLRDRESDGDGRLSRRCCPRATVHRWCCVLVRPRRSDCVVLALGLLCFVSSLSLETALLLRYEEHVMLVVASLVVGALLLASCCMGGLVWWKGPQWADDDRDASGAWVHEHRRINSRRGAPQPRQMDDEGSESEDNDEEGALLRINSRAGAAFDEVTDRRSPLSQLPPHTKLLSLSLCVSLCLPVSLSLCV